MKKNLQTHLDQLILWLRYASVSGDPEYDSELRAAADWLIKRLEKLGFKVELDETEVSPVVFAEYYVSKDLPTVLVYGHYDVQPADPIKEWKSKPFEPVIKNGKIFARGVADDKGQVYTWIAAFDEWLQKHKSFPCNVKMMIEGAEEQGSEGVAKYIKDNTQKLAADFCVISDSHSLSPTQPMISYGLRGLVYFEVTVKTLSQDAHSGIYGGAVLNAATVLSQMIAKLQDDKGRILIPGIYDSVRELTTKEEQELKNFPWSLSQIKSEVGAEVVAGDKQISAAEKVGALPSLDVHGIWGGFQGEGGKTIIPAQASAKISLRLVPDQDPQKISKLVTQYLKTITPTGVTLKIKELHQAEPVLVDRGTKYFKAAEKAMEQVFGNKPVYELSGGTIGVVADIKNTLGIDSIMMGYGLPDDGLHAPNEKMDVEMFEKGIQTNLAFLKLLEEIPHKNLKSH